MGLAGRQERMKYDDSAPVTAEARRRLILDTARIRFLEDGYTAAAMERVAREAGMSTATLYAAFPSKEDLFQAVVLDASAEFSATMRRIDLDNGSAVDRVRAFARGYAAFLADPLVRGVLRLVSGERRRMPDGAGAVFAHGRREVGGPFIRALTAMRDAGDLAIENPAWATGQLMGLIEHPLLTTPMMLGDGADLQARTPEQVADDAVTTFMARYGVRNSWE